jgi:dTDP-4-dehydrorhamnose reductase
MVLGSSGFVGLWLAERLEGLGHEVMRVRGPAGHVAAGTPTLDIRDGARVERLLGDAKVDTVLNAAAVADIDRAEADQELCWGVNVVGARNVAEACARHGARLIHLSSDAVFGDERQLHTEEDPIAPVNFYGTSKAESEKEVLRACPGAAVLRLSLVLGPGFGNSLVAKLERANAEGATVVAPREERRTPIDVFTLGACVAELCELPFSGILHLGATEPMSRFEIHRRLLASLGFFRVRLESRKVNSVRRAPRGKNGCLDVQRARRILRTELLSPVESIERVVASGL